MLYLYDTYGANYTVQYLAAYCTVPYPYHKVAGGSLSPQSQLSVPVCLK